MLIDSLSGQAPLTAPLKTLSYGQFTGEKRDKSIFLLKNVSPFHRIAFELLVIRVLESEGDRTANHNCCSVFSLAETLQLILKKAQPTDYSVRLLPDNL